jgi:hypothetical protein
VSRDPELNFKLSNATSGTSQLGVLESRQAALLTGVYEFLITARRSNVHSGSV